MGHLDIIPRYVSLVFISLQLIIVACAGSQKTSTNERKHIEGIVVEGGRSHIKLKDDDGNILHIAAGKDVEYVPMNMHAYYGDRVRVIYFTDPKRSKSRHRAIRMVLIEADEERFELRGGTEIGVRSTIGFCHIIIKAEAKYYRNTGAYILHLKLGSEYFILCNKDRFF